MIREGNKPLLILGVIIALFFTFWQINRFPQDLNPEVIIGADALRCLERGHTERIVPQDCFRQLCNRWETMNLTFRNYDASLVRKLWLLILSVSFHMLSYSVFSIVLTSSMVSIIALLLTYKLGRLLYSEAVGILAGIFLSTSIAYNMTVRSSYGFTVTTVTSLVVFYCVYKYLVNGIKHYLIITGILLGIGSLDAPPQFFFIPATVTLILAFNFSGKIKDLAKNLKDIAVLFILAVITSVVLTALYAWYYNTTVFSIYNEIYFWLNQRLQGAQATHTHQYFSKGLIDSLKYAVIFIKNIFIGMSPFDLDDYALLLEGVPMITPIVSVFFIIGLFYLSIKSKADRLLLIWLAINFLAYMFLIRVQTRYVEIFIPVICIVGAYGIVKIISKINLGKYSYGLRQAIYILIILAVSYIGYKNFFVTYRNNDANLRRFYNNSKIAEFVVKNSKPEECLVVLAENFFSCRDAVVFNMRYRPYKVLYLEEILYNRAKSTDKRQISTEEAKEAILGLEAEALKGHKTIYYIFSEHSLDYYFPAMVGEDQYAYINMFKDIFLSLHPFSRPVEILRYSDGSPTHSIFMVTW